MAPKVKTKNIKGTGFVHIRDLIQKTRKDIEALFEKQGMVTGVPAGFRDLDLVTSGLQRSDLVILAGRPGMGKTALALNIARNIAVKEKVGVALFSMEMSKEQVAFRLLGAEAKIDGQKLRAGYVKSADLGPLYRAADVLSESSCAIVNLVRDGLRRGSTTATYVNRENESSMPAWTNCWPITSSRNSLSGVTRSSSRAIGSSSARHRAESGLCSRCQVSSLTLDETGLSP